MDRCRDQNISIQQKLPQDLEHLQLVEQVSSLASGVWMLPASDAPLPLQPGLPGPLMTRFQICLIWLQSGLAGWVAVASVSLG